MLNPALIKHDLDREEYADACPTIGSLLIGRFSTPDRHQADVYSADSLFFSLYPSRHLYLREAFPREYDNTECIERPKLWIAVMQFASGVHMRLPVFRGSSFWGELNTDASVVETIRQMCLKGGLSLSEWYGFICDQRIRKSDEARSKRRRKGEAIH